MKTISLKSQASATPLHIEALIEKADEMEKIALPAGHGQLPVDIFETAREILLITPIAGVDLDKTDVIINNDVLTIRGKREIDLEGFGFKKEDLFVQECFWGPFERSVILPPHLDTSLIEATQKGMVLYIRIPKRKNVQVRLIRIKS